MSSRPAQEEGFPLATADPLTVSNLGTKLYMAPEQYEGRADARTDVWGLGVTLYELLTFRRAFDKPNQTTTDNPPHPRHLVGNIPPDLDAICWKAIRKDPAQRYQAARDIAEDLRRWLNFEPTKARPARPIRRVALWARRNRGWAAAIVLAIGASLAGVWVWAMGVQAEERRQSHEALAGAREQSLRRESLIQRIRMTSHVDGWSEEIWELARRGLENRTRRRWYSPERGRRHSERPRCAHDQVFLFRRRLTRFRP